MSLTEAIGKSHSDRSIVRPEIPHGVSGRNRSIKTILNTLMLSFFFGAPWLRWDRGPSLPDQALLFDMPGRRLFVFGLEFWPQDLPIAVGVMIGAALALFYATTLAGRVWCGFSCPQTVWSDLFFSIDRLIARFSGRGSGERMMRMAVWLAISALTGLGFATWFNDAPTLASNVFTGSASAGAYATILLLTGTTFFLAAYARERVCLHMCPWPRFQAALLDRQSLVVTYQDWRGEPRGRKRIPLRPDLSETGLARIALEAVDLGGQLQTRGDCIDCTRCVTACPTGVDIRKGLQMGCIGCGLCIDACDDVMTRLERPKGLIRFDNETSATARSYEAPSIDWLRPKAMVLALATLIAISLSAWGAATMPRLVAHAEPQRNPPFIRMSDGSIRNDYALRLSHRIAELPTVSIRIDGLDGADMRLGAQPDGKDATLSIPVGANRSAEERILITLPAQAAPKGRQDFAFVLHDNEGWEIARIASYFWGPQR